MMDKPFISAEQVSILESGAAGALLSLLFQGKITPWKAVLIFSSGEICAFYITQPFAAATGLNQGACGLTIGLMAMFLISGAVNFGARFAEDPWNYIKMLPIPGLKRSASDADDVRD